MMDCVAFGFTLAYWKAYLGQTKCYIRPVLKDVVLDESSTREFSGAKRTPNQLWMEGLTSMQIPVIEWQWKHFKKMLVDSIICYLAT